MIKHIILNQWSDYEIFEDGRFFLWRVKVYRKLELFYYSHGVIITHWKNYLLYLYSLKTGNATEVVNDNRT